MRRAAAAITRGWSGASDQGGVVGAKATRRMLSGEGSWWRCAQVSTDLIIVSMGSTGVGMMSGVSNPRA
jgi:hypothetical protein